MLLLLVSFSFCLSFMSSTYSRYVAGTTGNIDLLLAKWQILVNNRDIANQNNSNITFTPVIETNNNIKSNTIAPTSKGYFDIDINPTNVDVSFRYQIALSISNNSIPDLVITKYAILPNNYHEGDLIEYTTLQTNTITNDMIYDLTTQNFRFQPFTIRIYFEWLEGTNESMNDAADTAIGVGAANSNTTAVTTSQLKFILNEGGTSYTFAGVHQSFVGNKKVQAMHKKLSHN